MCSIGSISFGYCLPDFVNLFLSDDQFDYIVNKIMRIVEF